MKTQRLRRLADVVTTLGGGSFRGGTAAVLHCRASQAVRPSETGGLDPRPRATVVAGRKVGGATRRNRAKRRLRAALEQCRIPPGHDFVLVARPGAVSEPFETLVVEVQRLLDDCVAGTRRTRAAERSVS